MSDTLSINDLLARSLGVLEMRQKVIANNVANAETPGYRAGRVAFEELLSDAMDTGGRSAARDVEFELFESEASGDPVTGNNVNLEGEVGDLIKNTLQFKTYMRLLGKRFKQLDLAIRGSY